MRRLEIQIRQRGASRAVHARGTFASAAGILVLALALVLIGSVFVAAYLLFGIVLLVGLVAGAATICVIAVVAAWRAGRRRLNARPPRP